jgi:hypothetical protein
LIEPLSGIVKIEWLTRDNAAAKATKTIISARTLVSNIGLYGLISCLGCVFIFVSLRQY